MGSDTKAEKPEQPRLLVWAYTRENRIPINPQKLTVWLNYLGRPWLPVHFLLSCLEPASYYK